MRFKAAIGLGIVLIPAFLFASGPGDGQVAVGQLKEAVPADTRAVVPVVSMPAASREPGGHISSSYEVLRDFFKMGGPAVESNLTGWHSGRLIHRATPERFEPRLLIGARAQDNSEGQDNTEFNAVYFMGPQGEPPTYYDVLSPSSVSEIKSLLPIQEKWAVSFPATGAEAGAPGGKPAIQYHIFGGYIFERWTINTPDGATEDVYSYYLVNVTP